MAEPRKTEAGGEPVVHQTVVLVGAEKNVGAAVVLALLFGPLGMLYTTVGGALVMFAIGAILAFSISLWAPVALLPITVFWAAKAATWHNDDLAERAGQLAADSAASTPDSA
jgi:hypothetical protein